MPLNTTSEGGEPTEERRTHQGSDGPLGIPYSGRHPPNDGVESTVDGGQQCPLCGFSSDDRDDVYVHLMAAHRKSRLSSALLVRTEEA